MKLNIIVASTRPGRVGRTIAEWFHNAAVEHGGFECELVDLKEVGLPIYDEPRHPRLQQYEHEHTRRWSESVASADAFAIVTPEYNFSSPPALVNAFDYVYREWGYKPAGFVSYGGVSGGLRSVQMSKQILTTLKVMPIPEAVTIPMVSSHVKDGHFQAQEIHRTAAATMLTELGRWAKALKPLREEA